MRLLNRSQPDKFEAIIKETGETVEGSEGIEKEIVDFYKNLYELYDKDNVNVRSDDNFFEHIEPVSGAEQAATVAPITADELLK